jgi:hypothetical protein
MSDAIAPVETAQAPVTETAAPEAPKAPPQRFKVKLPEGEREVDADELVTNYQLKQASYKKFEEASAESRAAKEQRERLRANFIKELIEDPEVGKDKFKEEVIKFLYDEFQEEELSPEQLKAKKYDELQRQKQESEENERRTAAEKAEQEEVDRYTEQLTTTYVKALDSVNLPKTTSTLRAMAYLHQVADEAGADLDEQALAHITRDALFQEQKGLFLTAAEEGRILEVIDPEVIDAIRKADLERIRARKNAKTVSAADYAAGDEDGPRTRLDPEEALKRFLESD